MNFKFNMPKKGNGSKNGGDGKGPLLVERKAPAGKPRAKVALKIKDPGPLFAFWEDKASNIMSMELILAIFWTLVCTVFVATVCCAQNPDAEEIVGSFFEKEFVENTKIFRKFTLLLGLAAILDNFMNVCLVLLLGTGLRERDWRKCGLWIIGKTFMFLGTITFAACMKMASISASSPSTTYTGPNFMALIFVFVMANYRVAATCIIHSYIKAAQEEEELKPKPVPKVGVSSVVLVNKHAVEAV